MRFFVSAIQSFWILLIFIVPTLEAQDTAFWQKSKSGHSQARLLLDHVSVGPEASKILVGVEIQLESGWYTYWRNAGDVGYAPRATWQLPTTWSSSGIRYPVPKRHEAPGKKQLTSFGYKDQVLYLMELQGQGELSGRLTWDYLICEKLCIPEKVVFDFQIPSKNPRLSAHNKKLIQAVNHLPQKIENLEIQWINPKEFRIPYAGEIRDVFLSSPKKQKNFWSWQQEGDSILVTLTEPLDDLEVLVDAGSRSFETGPLRAITASPVAANSDSTSLWLALLFALIGGFILNFMPCVLPVVMIKTHSLLVAASDHSAKGVSFKANLLATSLGVISSFLALGILTGSLREAGHQVGWGFQFQIPSFLIFMILVLFLFALNLFGLFEFQLPHGLTQRLGGRSGEKTHSFLEGVFATILATPCSAPFLGTALTFGLTQGWLALIGIFVSMGVGLALPYLILLVRPQWIRLLPRPGAWMGGLKRWMAYLLLLTALWLAYVLQQQVSSLLLILLLFGLGAIFISLRELRSSLRWAFVLLVSLGLILVSRSPQINASSPQTETTKFVFSPEAVDQKLREGKTLFLYITADWCLTCKFNEAAVIEHPEFVRKLREKSIEVVRVDWTKRDPLVGQYLESFNRVGIPFAVLLRGSDREVFPELMVLQDSLKRVDEFF